MNEKTQEGCGKLFIILKNILKRSVTVRFFFSFFPSEAACPGREDRYQVL